jgi:hypothetical protein
VLGVHGGVILVLVLVTKCGVLFSSSICHVTSIALCGFCTVVCAGCIAVRYIICEAVTKCFACCCATFGTCCRSFTCSIAICVSCYICFTADIALVVAIACLIGASLKNYATTIVTYVVSIFCAVCMNANGFCAAIITYVILVFILVLAECCIATIVTCMVFIVVYAIFKNCAASVVTNVVVIFCTVCVSANGF